jgi:hypothetical protein
MLVEGEFDALVVGQQAGALLTPVAAGSTHGARHGHWAEMLAKTRGVLVGFDADPPGDEAAAWWLGSLPQAVRWRPYWSDVAQMHQDGADIRAWVEAGLIALGNDGSA